MGKATFLKLLDRKGKIQCYVRRDEIGEEEYKAFKKLDLGDFIGIRGPLFRTKTGEVTARAKEYRLVSKAFVHCRRNGMVSQIMNKFIASDTSI